jgi:hypothetical protein
MAHASTADSTATVLVLDTLRPVREALRQVFDERADGETEFLERLVRWCGSAPVYVGTLSEARRLASRLEANGLTTSVNLGRG